MQLYSWADKLNLTDKSYLQYRGKRMVNIYEGLCFYLSLHKLYHYRNYVVDFASGVACSDIVRLAGYPLNKGSLILLKDLDNHCRPQPFWEPWFYLAVLLGKKSVICCFYKSLVMQFKVRTLQVLLALTLNCASREKDLEKETKK